MIKINLDKAKEIHKQNLRAARTEAFKPLDVAFMKALESGQTDQLSEITSKKQELRDVTKLPDTIETVEDLKAHWPEVLGVPNPYEG